MASLTTSGAVAASAAAPLALRQFDSPGQSLTRPSVILPLGLGGALVGASMAVDRGIIAPPLGGRRGFTDLSMLSGVAMLGGGAVNAVTPTGGGSVGLPSL